MSQTRSNRLKDQARHAAWKSAVALATSAAAVSWTVRAWQESWRWGALASGLTLAVFSATAIMIHQWDRLRRHAAEEAKYARFRTGRNRRPSGKYDLPSDL